MSIAQNYRDRVAQGGLQRDAAQEAAAQRLDDFVTLFLHRKSKSGFLSKFTKAAEGKGLYLYGGVGRGKTMLMDMAVAFMSDHRVRRVHFHAFMLEIHERLKGAREDGETRNFIDAVAQGIAKDIDLLCFDEIHVNDIADAMILGPLFEALFHHGVWIIATSNYMPDDLYKNGLQRQRFLPFIALLKNRMSTVFLDSPTDYRLRALSESGVYFHPLNDFSWAAMDRLFTTLTGHEDVHPTQLDIRGRTLDIARSTGDAAYLTFEILCREARGAEDYLALGHHFHTVFVDGVPVMDESTRNEARRFMTLVDTLYDLHRVLVIRAAAPATALYAGETHGFEFQRTVSRLIEMQSDAWMRQNS